MQMELLCDTRIVNVMTDIITDGDFRHHLDQLASGIEPNAGFFTPDSLIWRINREPALLLVGMRALLLQIAHPKVAQGVADHSRYREDPLGRGIRTFTAMYSLLFGLRDEAVAAALRIRDIHNRVHGVVRDPLPPGMGADYDANDPELLFWVAATLLDSAVIGYELFVAKLSAQEKDRFLKEAQRMGVLFGIPASLYPEGWSAFQTWMTQQLHGDTLSVTPTAREICHNLLAGTWFTRLLSPFNYAMAAMLLPDPIASSFGLKRSLWARGVYYAMLYSMRLLVHITPYAWRGVPAARRRERR